MTALVRTFRVKGLNDPKTPVAVFSFQYQEEDLVVRVFHAEGNQRVAFVHLFGQPREEFYRGSGLDQTFFVTVQKEDSTRVGHILEYTTSAGEHIVDLELVDAIDDEWPLEDAPMVPQGEDPAFPNTKIPRRQFHPVELSVTIGGLEPEGPATFYSQDLNGYPDVRNYTIFNEGRWDHFHEPPASVVWVRAFKEGKDFVGNIVLPAGSSRVSLDFDPDTGDMTTDVVLFPPSQSPLQEFGGSIRRVAPGFKAPDIYTLEFQITKEGVPTPSAMKSVYVYRSQQDTTPAAIYQILNGFSEKQYFTEDIIGDWFVQAMDEEPPRLGSLRWPSITEQDTVIRFDLSESQQVRPDPGIGILSGSFPLTLLTDKDSAPTKAVVRVLYRTEEGHPGDGVLITTTTCNADGTWQVAGLNEDEKFDVVARIPGYNDVIISDVQPTGAPLSAHFANLKEEYEYQEEVEIQVVAMGGRPPYAYQAVTLPDGLSFNSGTGYITGTINSYDLIFEFLISDSEGTQFSLIGTSFVDGDPYWNNVVSLLHFDGDLTDEKGWDWTLGSGASIDSVSPILGTGSLKNSGVGDGCFTSNPIGDPSALFTFEGFVRLNALPVGQGYDQVISPLYEQSQNASGGEMGVGYDHITEKFLLDLRGGSTSGPHVYSEALPVELGRPYHFAHSYDGTTHRLFLDGEMIIEMPLSTGWKNTAQPFRLGQSWVPNYSAYRKWAEASFDEFRVTKGVSRYTENFTPPTKPFPNY